MVFEFDNLLKNIKKPISSTDYNAIVTNWYKDNDNLETTMDQQQFVNKLVQDITQQFDIPDQKFKYIVTVTTTSSDDSSSTQTEFAMATLWNNSKDDVFTIALSSHNYKNRFYIINIFVISKSD